MVYLDLTPSNLYFNRGFIETLTYFKLIEHISFNSEFWLFYILLGFNVSDSEKYHKYYKQKAEQHTEN